MPGGQRKIRNRPARADKRARNVAKKSKGEPTARGAKRTRLTPVQLALMGKGAVRRYNPPWAVKHRPITKRLRDED